MELNVSEEIARKWQKKQLRDKQSMYPERYI